MKNLFTLLLTISFVPFLATAQNVGVDVAVPVQKLDVDGGIRIGNTANGVAGSLRWDGTNIQYHDGTNWINLVANSDDQTLSIALNILTIEDGNTVDLTPYLDNTDEQNLSLAGTDLSISGGTGVDLAPLQAQLIDADSDTKVQVEESADEDKVRFDLAGTERWVMEGTRLEPSNSGNSLFIGNQAGAADDLSTNNNVAIGNNAMQNNVGGAGNAAVGAWALQNSTTGGNAAFGKGVLTNQTTGNFNTAMGQDAGIANISGSNNVLIGKNADQTNQTGSQNVMIGKDAGRLGGTSGSGNIFIGYQAGLNESGDDKLYIDNSSTTTPLIQGDFSANTLQVNGTLNVNGAYDLPTVDGAASGYVMTTDAAGTVTWVDPGLTGDITSIIAGEGLTTPDGSSGDVTIDINPDNSTVEVDSDILRVKPEGITANEIATDGVDSDEIAADAVGLSEIATGGVASAEIVDNSIDAIDINTGAVTTDEILDATILPGDLNVGGTANQILAVDPTGTSIIWTDAGAVSNQLIDLDADTKIEVEAAADEDYIRMSTAGGERVTIDPAGNVGVGIVDPTRALHVASATGGQILVSRDDATVTLGETLGEILFDAEDDNASTVDASAVIRAVAAETATYGNSDKGGELQFLTKANATDENASATERMSIEQGGDVRIGASSSSGNDLYINDRIIDWDNSNYFLDPASADGNRVNEIQSDQGSAADPSYTFISDNNTGIFQPSAGHMALTANGSERVRMTDQGNVGIGTPIPNEKLHIVGNQRIISDDDVTTSLTSGALRIENVAGTNTLNLDFNEIQSNGDALYLNNDGAQDVRIGNTDFAVDVSTTNVGIGTITPTEKLHVNGGTARISGLAGTGTRLVSADANGVLGAGADFGTLVTVENGITYNAGANRIRLGGSLVTTTTITHETFDMVFNMNSSGDFHIQDNGTNHFSVVNNGDTYFGSDVYWGDGNTGGTVLARLTDTGDDGIFDVFRDGAIQHRINGEGDTYFNEQSADRNFRIESDNLSSMFWLDAGLDRIGLNETAPKTMLHIADPTGNTLMLERADGTITTNEQLGGIGFDGGDGNTPDDIKEASAAIIAFATETHGTGDKGGRLTFWTSPTNQNDDTDGFERMRIDQDGNTYVGGDMYWRDASVTGTNIARIVDDGDDGQLILYEDGITQIMLDANGTSVFNERSLDRNFRVESNGDDNMIFVDGGLNRVGIGTGSPAQALHVDGNARIQSMAGSGTRALSVEADGDLTTAQPTTGDAGFWTKSGTTLFPTDVSANIDMNGENITDVVIIQMNETHGDNGSVTDPSYTFNSDQDLGMYRYGTNHLGFTAGGSIGMSMTNSELDLYDNNVTDVNNLEVDNIYDADGGSRIEVQDDFDMNNNDVWAVNDLTVQTIYDNGGDVVHFDQGNTNTMKWRFDVGDNYDFWIDRNQSPSFVEPLLRPGGNNIGYVGDHNRYWYRMYARQYFRILGDATFSDERFKENIRPLMEPSEALEKLLQVETHTYDIKPGSEIYSEKEPESNVNQIGLIAQEVQAIFPDIVVDGGGGYLAVQYESIMLYMIEAIKEQQSQIKALSSGNTSGSDSKLANENAELRSLIEQMQERLEALESKK